MAAPAHDEVRERFERTKKAPIDRSPLSLLSPLLLLSLSLSLLSLPKHLLARLLLPLLHQQEQVGQDGAEDPQGER